MIVVSDTTAISSLIWIEKLNILEALYETVFIPEAVRDELSRSHPQLPPLLQVALATDRAYVNQLEAELDLGEAEAIVLAKEKQADLLLMDEKLGRAVAQREGVPIIGLMAVLTEAKRRRLISSVREEVSALETRAGFRVSARLKQQIFNEAGE